MSATYAATELKSFATSLFTSAGLPQARAEVMASVFLEADLLGFTTHGFNRIPTNVEWLLTGASLKQGEPKILADRGNVFNWDAEFLPGPWVLSQAIQQAMDRVAQRGIVAATIRRSQHIACLAAYFPQIVEAGYVGLITCSTPAENTVCPHGGIDPVFSANPIAFAAPADDYPLIMDISMSVTAGGYVARAQREGRKLPEPCLKDNQGNITDDPAALFSEPAGSILPLGGAGHGYKGYGLSMMTEVLSMALGGYGRANAESKNDGEANSVFLQIIDPQAFGSMAGFKRESAAMRELCENSRAKPGDPPVRVPGKRAWLKRQSQLEAGVELYPSIMDDIKPWAEKLGVALPTPQ
jgi:LDH2 family malate/lactate/ureidoglycolate dehydrogenase